MDETKNVVPVVGGIYKLILRSTVKIWSLSLSYIAMDKSVQFFAGQTGFWLMPICMTTRMNCWLFSSPRYVAMMTASLSYNKPFEKVVKNSSFYEGHYSGGNFKYIFCRWGICQINDKPCPFDVALVLEEDFLTGVFGELEVLRRTNSQLNLPWSKSFFFYLSHCSHVDSISTFRILND